MLRCLGNRVLFLCLMLIFAAGQTGCLRVNEANDGKEDWEDQKDSLSVFAPALDGLKAKGQTSGLLLSLAYTLDVEEEDKLPPRTRYRTYFFRFGGKENRLAGEYNFIPVPSDKKFFYIGEVFADTLLDCNLKLGRAASAGKRYSQLWTSRNRNDSALFASKLMAQMSAEAQKLECDQQYLYNEFVRYAGTGFVLKNVYSSKRSLTGRAANDHYLQELVLLEGRKGDWALKKLLPNAKLKKTQDALEEFILADTTSSIRIVDENNVRKFTEADSLSVGFLRMNGLVYWSARSGGFPFYDLKNHWVSGTAAKEYVMGVAPKTLLAHNAMPLLLDELKIIRPNVVDVFVSPDESYVVVLTQQQIIAIEARSRKVLFTQPLNFNWKPQAFEPNSQQGSGVVMAEWADEELLKTWSRILK